MREIKFRGLSINGSWRYGLVARKDNDWFISNRAFKPFAYHVRPETVGQSIGLRDKNGVEIYEGDVLEHSDGYIEVIWDYKNACFAFEFVHDRDSVIAGCEVKDCIVIGNVHQNPELLEESV